MCYGQLRLISRQIGLIICLSGLVLIANPVSKASAQVLLDRARLTQLPSSKHDLGLTFLSLAGVQPDFDELVTSSEAYKKRPDANKEAFLKTEKLNLQTKYLALNPKENHLMMRMSVNVDFQRHKDGTSDVVIKFPGDGMVYFPFYYGKYPVALLVNDIEMFQQFGLGPEETIMAATKLDITGVATLFLDLIPLQADAKTPLKLDGTMQYPMLTKIAVIALLNNKGEQIWGWQAAIPAKKNATLNVPASPTSNLSLNPIVNRAP